MIKQKHLENKKSNIEENKSSKKYRLQTSKNRNLLKHFLKYYMQSNYMLKQNHTCLMKQQMIYI